MFGINISNLSNYLINHNSDNILFLFWLQKGVLDIAKQYIRTTDGSDHASTMLRCNIQANGVAVFTVAGAVIDPVPAFSAASDAQVAYLYQGPNKPVKTWLNSLPRTDSTGLTASFSAADVGKTVVIGNPHSTTANDAVTYRVIVENLTKSTRDAGEVVQKDWNYVKAIGEFEGIEKRPFGWRLI